MSSDNKKHPVAVQGVQGLQPYQPGKPIDELARELGLDPASIIKLASNENPLGPSEKALAAIQAELPELCRYPDGNGFELKQKLSQRLGIDPAQLTLGNGSNDILELVARAFADSDSEVVYSQHAFAIYAIATQEISATHVPVPAKDWGHDLDAMAAAVNDKTRVIFVANPNNPTGTAVGRDALDRFLNAVPSSVIVVLDEAYGEYIDDPDFPDGLQWIGRHPNLVVTRTFSKAWGLAALRVGYAVSSPEVADILNRVRQPFNVSALGLAAAAAVLDDEAYLERSRALNRKGMQQLEVGFQSLGLSYIPSKGNFIAVDVGREAMPVYQGLLQEGVIVRPVGGYGMPNHLRVSIGLPEENRRFLEALGRVLERLAHT